MAKSDARSGDRHEQEMVEIEEGGALVDEEAQDDGSAPAPLSGGDGSADKQPFRRGMWGAYPQWACRLCKWDTLNGEDAFWEHYLARHVTPVAPEQPVVQVYDRFGRPV